MASSLAPTQIQADAVRGGSDRVQALDEGAGKITI